MHVAICDDDEMSRFFILKLLSEYASANKSINLSFSSFSGPEALLDITEKMDGFDIYILDIVMPEMNGIELGTKLRERGYDGSIIYLTASPEFALDSYKVEAANYILKPINWDAFKQAFDKVVSSVVGKKHDNIIVKTKECSMRLSYDRILYVELRKRALCYHLDNGNTVESILIRVPFVEAIAPLLEDTRFSHCSKTLAVNLHNITKIGIEEVTFKDNQTVYFSKKICRDLRTEWFAYWQIYHPIS